MISFKCNLYLLGSLWFSKVLIANISEVKGCKVSEWAMTSPLSVHPPTLLCTEVWNMRESCGRPRSAQALDFLTGRHCVRETDVNSWNRDTCVWFMCCLRVDVWCCLKSFWIDIPLKHPDLHMMSMVKVKRNTLTHIVNSYLNHTVLYACGDWWIVVAFLSIRFPNRFPQSVPFDNVTTV